MARITADALREVIIGLIVENAQVRAAASPVAHGAFLDEDELPEAFDQALDEINVWRSERQQAPVEVDDSFKQNVIDTMIRRAEAAGRMRAG
jgi:hypothetical protein